MNQMETIIAEIKQLDPAVLGEVALRDPKGYVNRVFGFLNSMVPCKVYKVSELANSETERLFVLVVQLYQCEVKGCTVSFLRNDYKELRKN